MKKVMIVLTAMMLIVGMAGTAMAAEATFQCVDCAGEAGYLDRGCEGSQDSCYNFDWDYGWGTFNGTSCNAGPVDYWEDSLYPHCTGKARHKALFPICNCEFDPALATGDYVRINMTILVNGEEGEHGVYWAEDINSMLVADSFNSETLACNAECAENAFYDTWNYIPVSGTADITTTPVFPAGCEIEDEYKYTRIEAVDNGGVSTDGLQLTGAEPVIWVDIPQMRVIPDEIERGDEVIVRVEIFKSGEATLVCTGCDCSCDIYIGKLCCPLTEGGGTDMYFPFMPKLGGWYDAQGIAITNLEATDGDVVVKLYEADGDVAEATFTVEGNKSLLLNASDLEAMTVVEANGDGVIGGQSYYIKAGAEFSGSGLAFFANSTSGESMGYTPID